MLSPWALCLFYFAAHVQTAKILGIFPFPSDTHQETYRALTQALAAKGHDVTVITTHPVEVSAHARGSHYKNIREINKEHNEYLFNSLEFIYNEYIV